MEKTRYVPVFVSHDTAHLSSFHMFVFGIPDAQNLVSGVRRMHDSLRRTGVSSKLLQRC